MALPYFKRKISLEELRQRIGRDDPFIIEAGAHDGSDTLGFLRAFPRSQVCSFECDPRPIERFKVNTFPYTIGGRVHLYEMAVSDQVGEHVFHQSTGQPKPQSPITDWDHSSSLLAPTGHYKLSPWCKFENQLTVPTTSLDAWLAKTPWVPKVVDLIWADLQGAEHLMLAGAVELLKRTRFLYQEFYDTPMYAGQLPLAQLLEILGPGWEALATYEGCNFLAINHNVKSGDQSCPRPAITSLPSPPPVPLTLSHDNSPSPSPMSHPLSSS